MRHRNQRSEAALVDGLFHFKLASRSLIAQS
jgi:hypothetical protein